jgi:phospholipid transport system transporter-binding protein
VSEGRAARGAARARELRGTFELSAASAGHLTARGALTFATARAARAAGAAALASAAAGALEIDCSGVSPADSAGLAVLLDWLAIAKSAGRSLAYLNLPQDLVALARISEVEGLLQRGV